MLKVICTVTFVVSMLVRCFLQHVLAVVWYAALLTFSPQCVGQRYTINASRIGLILASVLSIQQGFSSASAPFFS